MTNVIRSSFHDCAGAIMFRNVCCRSRKRRPSTYNDSERCGGGWGERMHICRRFRTSDFMDDCTAALVLMSLSGSPHSPDNLPPHCQCNECGEPLLLLTFATRGVANLFEGRDWTGVTRRSQFRYNPY